MPLLHMKVFQAKIQRLFLTSNKENKYSLHVGALRHDGGL